MSLRPRTHTSRYGGQGPPIALPRFYPGPASPEARPKNFAAGPLSSSVPVWERQPQLLPYSVAVRVGGFLPLQALGKGLAQEALQPLQPSSHGVELLDSFWPLLKHLSP